MKQIKQSVKQAKDKTHALSSPLRIGAVPTRNLFSVAPISFSSVQLLAMQAQFMYISNNEDLPAAG